MPRLRDLPWRHTRDPWAVLVSEVMLQQTQVPRVVPKWHAFLEQFPTTAACAAASLGDVLRLWQGLGYPRRARNLHATAVEVERLGAFPDTLDGLLALPGVGAYTARAVLAFAYEADAAVVDTNIARVVARHVGRRLTQREVQAHRRCVTAARASRGSGTSASWISARCCAARDARLRVDARCGPPAPGGGRATTRPSASAGVSRTQARFEGSDRQARGRLLKALGAGPLALDDVGAVDAASARTGGGPGRRPGGRRSGAVRPGACAAALAGDEHELAGADDDEPGRSARDEADLAAVGGDDAEVRDEFARRPPAATGGRRGRRRPQR